MVLNTAAMYRHSIIIFYRLQLNNCKTAERSKISCTTSLMIHVNSLTNSDGKSETL